MHKARLQRTRNGRGVKNIFTNFEEQTAHIISKVLEAAQNARGYPDYYDAVPDTYKEWNRLRTNLNFKNEAPHQLISSFDAFVEEFGMCKRGKKYLVKINKKHTQWKWDYCKWSKTIH